MAAAIKNGVLLDDVDKAMKAGKSGPNETENNWGLGDFPYQQLTPTQRCIKALRRGFFGPRRSFTDFLLNVWKARQGGHVEKDEGRRTLEKSYGTEYGTHKGSVTKTAMGETSGQIGGYLVPRDFTYRILETVAEDSFFFSRAQVLPMRAQSMSCPIVDATTVQAIGTSPFFGSLLFKWGNSQAPGETEPAFRSVELTAWDLLGYGVVSHQWLWDVGQEGEDYLINLLGRAASWYAEYAFLNGTGAAQSMPLGIVNSPGSRVISRQTPNVISNKDVGGMTAALLPSGWKRSIWACSPATLAQVMQIPNYFINTEVHEEGGQAGSLVTRPVFVTEKLAALGSLGDFVLFDPWLYVIGMRQEVVVDVSEPGPGFPTNQVYFRVWLRCDGKPMVPNFITLADGTSQVGQAVILK